MTQYTVTVMLDTERSPMIEISLNDGTGDIPHQFTRTLDAMWIEEYIDEHDVYTWHKFDTAVGALNHVCTRWSLDVDDYPDALSDARDIDDNQYSRSIDARIDATRKEIERLRNLPPSSVRRRAGSGNIGRDGVIKRQERRLQILLDLRDKETQS